MAPTLVREPFHRDGWAYEEKVDGWRMLAYKDGERVRLVSRHGRDHTRRFADLAAAIGKVSPRSLVLDGQVAIYDQQLRSRFDWLREPDPPADPVGACSAPRIGRKGNLATYRDSGWPLSVMHLRNSNCWRVVPK
jgi:hypothetical protein